VRHAGDILDGTVEVVTSIDVDFELDLLFEGWLIDISLMYSSSSKLIEDLGLIRTWVGGQQHPGIIKELQVGKSYIIPQNCCIAKANTLIQFEVPETSTTHPSR
jgi:hypothetical protein